MIRAYLAGPGVFLPDPQTYFDNKKEICKKYNILGISPIDLNLDPVKFKPFDFACKISSNNESLMRSSDCIIADLTPYHGVSADVGTAFELGYMRALNKPLFAYSNTDKFFYDRCIEEYGPLNGFDVFNRPQVNNMAIENFNMYDNLMLDGAITSSNSKLFTGDVPKKELYTSLIIFENAVKSASEVYNTMFTKI